MRQVFYRLVAAGVVAKTEGEYKATVVRLLGDLRREGVIPYGWVADHTRWMRKPRSYDRLEDALAETARTYRRALWRDQTVDVEVWLEKDALAGVLYTETAVWDVPLMVTRGYPSLSFLAEAAEVLAAAGRPVHLYYFGDWDPSGLDIARHVEKALGELAPGADLRFQRVAVTAAQIARWALPTRPTKGSDSRSGGFAGGSVEVDALPPVELRRLVRSCVERHLDAATLTRTRDVERQERETLAEIARGWTR